MSQLRVLAFGPCLPGVLFAEISFSEGRRQLRCSMACTEAADFLNHHPGTLVVCEGWPGGKWNEQLSRLVREGQPSVFIILAGRGEQRVEIEVGQVRNEETLREFVQHPELMREIQEIWGACRSAFAEFNRLETQNRTLPLM